MDLALVEAVQSGEAVEQSCLTTARRPHHRHHLTRGDGQIHPAQGVHLDLTLAKGLVDVLSLDNGMCHVLDPFLCG